VKEPFNARKLKFEDRIERDVALAALHRTKVRVVAGEYRAVCGCLWRGEVRASMAAADRDASAHRGMARGVSEA
jgi:hypothetical protein